MFELMEDPPLFPGEQEPATLADEFDRVKLRQDLQSVAERLIVNFGSHVRATYISHLSVLAENENSSEVRRRLRELLEQWDWQS